MTAAAAANTLTIPRTADVLNRLFAAAEAQEAGRAQQAAARASGARSGGAWTPADPG